MNKDDKSKRRLKIQKEASILLASEMSEIKGGTMSLGCGSDSTQTPQDVDSDEMSTGMGCAQCNKTHSCQTHT